MEDRDREESRRKETERIERLETIEREERRWRLKGRCGRTRGCGDMGTVWERI